ncbi:MAG: DUF4440 domain-containing protein [Bacillota bacterium]
MEEEVSLKALIYSLEERLIKPETRRNPEEVSLLLSEGFREFGSSGRIYDKSRTIEALRHEVQSSEAEIHDFDIVKLSESIVLATYRITRKSSGREDQVNSLRSSIWKFNGLTWEIIFHQGTPAENRAE